MGQMSFSGAFGLSLLVKFILAKTFLCLEAHFHLLASSDEWFMQNRYTSYYNLVFQRCGRTTQPDNNIGQIMTALNAYHTNGAAANENKDHFKSASHNQDLKIRRPQIWQFVSLRGLVLVFFASRIAGRLN